MMQSIVLILLCFTPIVVQSWELDHKNVCYITQICATPSPRRVFQNILDAARSTGGIVSVAIIQCKEQVAGAANGDTAARVYCGTEGDLYATKYFDCVTAYGVTEEQWIAAVGHACAYHAYPYAKTVAALSPYPRPYAVNQPQSAPLQPVAPVNYAPAPVNQQLAPQVQPAPVQNQPQPTEQKCEVPFICARSDRVQIMQKQGDLAKAAGGIIASSQPVCRTEAVGTVDPALASMRYCSSETEGRSLVAVYDACMTRRGVNLQVLSNLFSSACFGSR